ncbi:amidohydrolase family protein [Sediminibacter sp. Hel_I_10]|uniref:amidohydrolase family protein n=1 Tax=Sediminibacter sp. Hel_I_10 TaxID=1392490 RepID=UPI00047BDAF0|nr:amidohydrolase family protein [Sediminibacter sp. Hel_I_10]
MKQIQLTIVFAFLLNFTLGFAQQTPAQKQTRPIAITGATAHIGNEEVIDNSIIIFKEGKITTVQDMTMAKFDISGMEIINASGKHVYPGFIVPNSTLGLVEIDAVRATEDDAEMGSWNPHIRSLIAYNTESKIVESMRPNGVLIGQITPRSGRISGTSSVVQFDAWNWEDAAIKTDDGIHMNWPNNFSRGRWWLGEDPAMKMNENYDKQVMEIQDYFNASKAYKKGNQDTVNLPYAALEGLFDGTKKLYINVDDEKGIIDAINFAKAQNVEHTVLIGAYEAYKVADFIKKNNISILLRRVHTRPESADDDYDLPFKLAKLLTDKGITVALQANGDMERMNSRNLPFYAGTTVAYGLTKEQALQLITLNAAKILGIDKDYGSLEAGKSATLFISEGDALDMRTNILSKAFIDGRDISLETHQTELWRRYSEKYDLQKKL